MRRHVIALATLLAACTPALAFDDAVQSFADHFKVGKPVPASALVVLMMEAETWCYNQRDNECGWSEVYLSDDGENVRYELSNPWDEAVDIAYVSQIARRDDGQLCEIGFDWLPSLRAYAREDGLSLEGRDLEDMRQRVFNVVDPADSSDCYSYVYGGADSDAETMTLTQRQYIGGEYQPGMDAEVTLHFDQDSARHLGWYL